MLIFSTNSNKNTSLIFKYNSKYGIFKIKRKLRVHRIRTLTIYFQNLYNSVNIYGQKSEGINFKTLKPCKPTLQQPALLLLLDLPLAVRDGSLQLILKSTKFYKFKLATNYIMTNL